MRNKVVIPSATKKAPGSTAPPTPADEAAPDVVDDTSKTRKRNRHSEEVSPRKGKPRATRTHVLNRDDESIVPGSGKSLKPSAKTDKSTGPRKQVTANSSSATKLSTKKTKVEAANSPARRHDVNISEEHDEELEEEVSREKESRPPKRRRKTKEEKDKEAMPLAARTVGHRLAIGAHVSAAGGVDQSIHNALRVGCNSFALFLKSQRKWANPALKSEHANEFKILCKTHSYDAESQILPHGSYLVNLAQSDPEKAEQAYSSFLDDLKRCETLGIRLYNFREFIPCMAFIHGPTKVGCALTLPRKDPGNTNGEPRHEAIGRIAAMLNRAHDETTSVVTVLENMAAAGNTVGGSFEDLRDIIELVIDRTRVGVCIDTAHALAYGHELRDPSGFKRTMSRFDEIIGPEYLRAVHLNDSKAPFGSHRDLHQNIGLGFVGLRGFHSLVNDPRFAGLPLVLETPISVKTSEGKEVEDRSVWAREIKLLESLVGMDPDGEEFTRLEQSLADEGAEERSKHAEQHERKLQKQKKEKGTHKRLPLVASKGGSG